MLRKFFTLFGTLAIIAFFAGAVAIMQLLRPSLERQAPTVTPPTVFYVVAEPRRVTLDVEAQGEVRPRTDINLTAQVSGRIVATGEAFVEGGAFAEGDLLVKIEDADYRYALASARARVAQAEENLRREEAESALAKRDYEELGRSEDPSALALRQPQLAQAKAAYEAALADQRAAELDLERTNVKAPFKGRVRSRLAGKGQYVAPGAQLGRIFATDVVEIRLALADSDLAQLGLPIGFVESAAQPGPPAVLHATVAGEEREWQGRIARNDGAIDPSTRQTYAIAVVDDPYGEGADEGTPLAVGLFVRATIKGRPYDNAVTLPRSALYGRDTIYVIDDENRLRGRTVRVVFAGRDTITIAGEIAAGEKIAASPLRGANEGDKVAPTDPNAVKAGEQASAAAETIVQGERM